MEDIESKQTIHLILAELCGNRFFEGFVHSMLGVLKKVAMAVKADYFHPEGAHRPIVEAVLVGDSDSAQKAMRKHTEWNSVKHFLRMDKEYLEQFRGDSLTPSHTSQRKEV